jgi:hypothetical protein
LTCAVSLRIINSALNGRGGGKADMIQGSAACTKKEIEEYFIAKLYFKYGAMAAQKQLRH